MQDHEPDDDETFTVVLQGRPVGCLCVEDAAAVKVANAMLAEESEHFMLPEELDLLVSVLTRYGQSEAAETLSLQASRLRAAQYDRWNDG
jgi:hypothetical protein